MGTGWEQLREEGRVEGRAEGRAELLLVQLTARFGVIDEDTVDRVRRGTSAELDRWAVRLLTATTPAEALAPGPSSGRA